MNILHTLKLIERSNPDEDGWCKCSPITYTKLISQVSNKLVETCYSDECYRARLTKEAKIVLKYAPLIREAP